MKTDRGLIFCFKCTLIPLNPNSTFMSRFSKSHCEILHVTAFTGGLNRSAYDAVSRTASPRRRRRIYCPSTMAAVCIVKVKTPGGCMRNNSSSRGQTARKCLVRFPRFFYFLAAPVVLGCSILMMALPISPPNHS